jgi:hypothetical protein
LYVEGASIFILAADVINAPHVERTLSCYAGARANASQSHAHDPFRVDGIRSISAHHAGQTIRVSILGIDRDAGEEIWKRTQALHEAGGTVEVRQLSSANAQSDLM